MSISITATYRGQLNPLRGTFENVATFVVTGLSASSDNTFSLTSDGTSTGTALLPVTGLSVIDAPLYIPSNGNGNWYEKAVPTLDANGNVQLSITSGSSGPTAFRIAVSYGAA